MATAMATAMAAATAMAMATAAAMETVMATGRGEASGEGEPFRRTWNDWYLKVQTLIDLMPLPEEFCDFVGFGCQVV